MSAPRPAPLAADPWAGTTPRRWQAEALDAALSALRSGTRSPLIHAATGAGKSRLLGALAARCAGTVLLTTPTQYLVDQLAETLEEHCPGQVGRAYQHAWETDCRVVVTCNASLERLLDERPSWGAWLVDEAHRSEGPELRELQGRVVRRCAVGLTATPFRSDARGLAMWDRLVYSYTSHDAVRDGVLVPWRVVRHEGEDDLDAVCAEWVRSADGPGIVSATNVADAEAFASLCGGMSIHGYLPRDEQRSRRDALQAGRVPCLVHVQLLTEGVDWPWLRYLILRRKTASPVRLVQEVGRVLRAAPGKSAAVLYDPLDALGEVGLVHAAALEDAQARGSREPDEWSIPELLDLPDIPPRTKTVAVSRLAGWATDAVGELRGSGTIPPPEYGEGPWRQRRASEKQVAWLGRLVAGAGQRLDAEQRRAVEWLVEQPKMRAGTASDLLCILSALRRARVPVLPLPGGGA